jgi:phospholipid transport system transporter-binding protein
MNMVEASGSEITVKGDLTFASVPGLVNKAPDFKGGGELTINLSGVGKADSAGLAFLLGWIRKAKREGRDLKFTGIPAQIQSLVRVAGLGALFQLPDEESVSG